MIRGILEAVGLAKAPRGAATPLRAELARRQLWKALAGYEATSNDGANSAHWAQADGRAAWAANDPGTRTTLRNRCRHEVANSSLAAGIVKTLADDMIGTGPAVSVNTGNRATDRAIERAFAAWAAEIRLRQKLQLMRRAKCVDGESFGILETNERLEFVMLDLRVVEADQVATPDLSGAEPRRIDGVHLDELGDPSQFDVLRVHPGDDRGHGQSLEYDTLAAEKVIHVAHRTRPGEVRGVPEFTPALGLCAQLRRLTLASVLAAEIAAKFSGVLESQTPEGDADEVDPLDAFEVEPGSLMAMPEGWRLAAFKGEQPTTTYGEFRRHLVNEIGRCFNMPANVALGSSENMNFSSGRLDHGAYQASLRVERSLFEAELLDPLFRAWLREAVLAIPGIAADVELDAIDHSWRWPAFPSGDPAKDAAADQIYREMGVLSLERLYSSRFGAEWDRELEQIALERKFARDAGLEAAPGSPAGARDSRGTDADGAEGGVPTAAGRAGA